MQINHSQIIPSFFLSILMFNFYIQVKHYFIVYLVASVAEWLETLDYNHLPLNVVGRIPLGTLYLFMWGSYPASLQNVDGSTQVPTRAWNNIRRDTLGLPPPGKLLENRHITFTILVRRKPQPKNNKTVIYIFIYQINYCYFTFF